MNVHFDLHDGHDVARLPARLGLADANRIRRSLEDQLDGTRRSLVIDLSGVDFIDSSGLSALLAVIKAARRSEGDVVLAAPRPRVRALIELTRLDDVVSVLPTVAEASARLSARDRAA
jgi:anti-sigma B factor antagonist